MAMFNAVWPGAICISLTGFPLPPRAEIASMHRSTAQRLRNASPLSAPFSWFPTKFPYPNRKLRGVARTDIRKTGPLENCRSANHGAAFVTSPGPSAPFLRGPIIFGMNRSGELNRIENLIQVIEQSSRSILTVYGWTTFYILKTSRNSLQNFATHFCYTLCIYLITPQ